MNDQELYDRRGEEITRAMDHLALVERQRDEFRLRAEQTLYWQERAKRAESELAGVQLELARLEMNAGG